MQVDPVNPTLKAPGTKRLKLKYYELLSISAFAFKLRRYIEAHMAAHTALLLQIQAAAYTRPFFSSTSAVSCH